MFRLNHSLLDGEGRLGNTKFRNATDRIREECRRRSIKPPDCRDWDHLHGHYLAERDVFLTWDRGILRVADQLQVELGLVVMKPEDFLRKGMDRREGTGTAWKNWPEEELSTLVSSANRLLMAEESDQIARWTEPARIQGVDLRLEEERSARRAFRAWQQYNATGDRTALVELGILLADDAAPSEPADE